jgi:histone H3/H4
MKMDTENIHGFEERGEEPKKELRPLPPAANFPRAAVKRLLKIHAPKGFLISGDALSAADEIIGQTMATIIGNAIKAMPKTRQKTLKAADMHTGLARYHKRLMVSEYKRPISELETAVSRLKNILEVEEYELDGN